MIGAMALALAAASPAITGGVDAARYDAFWLWAGVRPQPVLRQAKRLYLLEGQVDAGPVVRLVAQRPAVPHVAGSEVWMVVRVGTLRWPPLVHRQLLAELGRWRAAGNHVAGVQIDFDAGTRHLGEYAAFLADLKRRLPADCLLGITGPARLERQRRPGRARRARRHGRRGGAADLSGSARDPRLCRLPSRAR